MTLFFSAGNVAAAEIVSVQPLTRNILVVHFDDGHVRHHLLGEPRYTEWVIGVPLDTIAASLPSTYAIASATDANYSSAKTPSGIYRKSKPTDFTWLCQNWTGNCENTDPDHASEHWFYLQLPFPMQAGTAYTLSLPGLTGMGETTFTFDDREQHSEAIHANLIGYAPGAPEKFGYVYHWLGDGGSMDFSNFANAPFHLVKTSDGTNAFSGQINFRKDIENQETAWTNQAPPDGNLVGVEVYECDFSSFATPGEYRLCVEGIGCSFPFIVGQNVYQEPYEAVLGGLYQQRSGIATEAPYTDQPRPAPHNPQLTPGFAGRLVYSTFRYPDFSENDAPQADKAGIDAAVLGPLDAWGWYQDAGDWDSYFSHTNVPLMLLWLYEMGWKKFGDGQLNLPEAGNGLPDLLDEATWLPRFHQRLRHELLDKNYGTGGVGGGRVFGDLWGGDELPDETTLGSWQDMHRRWACTGEDPFMTFKYAGLAAQIAFLLNENNLSDPDGIDWATEAVEAYNWASQNTLPQDTNLFGLPMLHVQVFASANIYRITGNTAVHQDFLDWHAQLPANLDLSNELLFGLLAYTQTEGFQPIDMAALNAAKGRLEAEADFLLDAFRDNRACRWGGNFWQPLLIGQPTTPLVQAGIIGHFLLKNTNPSKAGNYRAALYSTADYFLGNNPLNMTWITGTGERSPEQIFNLDSWYIGGDTPRKGIVPYGPWDASGWSGALGPWNHYWAFKFIYPNDKDAWPAHERWFEQRTAPLTNEYTIHQTLAPSILTYGYLYSLTAEDYVTNVFENGRPLLEVSVSPNPVSGVLNIKTELAGSVSFSIMDALGRVVMRADLFDKKLNVSNLHNGFYTLVLKGENGEWGVAKFVVE